MSTRPTPIGRRRRFSPATGFASAVTVCFLLMVTPGAASHRRRRRCSTLTRHIELEPRPRTRTSASVHYRTKALSSSTTPPSPPAPPDPRRGIWRGGCPSPKTAPMCMVLCCSIGVMSAKPCWIWSGNFLRTSVLWRRISLFLAMPSAMRCATLVRGSRGSLPPMRGLR